MKMGFEDLGEEVSLFLKNCVQFSTSILSFFRREPNEKFRGSEWTRIPNYSSNQNGFWTTKPLKNNLRLCKSGLHWLYIVS